MTTKPARAAQSHHDRTWIDGPLLGFDTETTGVNPFKDRIVSAALVGRGRRGTEQRTWLIDPGVEIPEEAAAIHGISTAHARERGMDPATALAQISAELVAAFRHGVPVVAFNASFDLTIIERELERHGLVTIGERLGSPLAPVLDPLVLDRGLDRHRLGKRKLVDLCGHYGVQERGELHTADVDVAATLDVLAEQTRRHPGLADRSLPELQRWQTEQHRSWAEDVNADRADKGLPGAITLEWPLCTVPETMTA
ncbi:DNA polymerase III subunit epsilon [Occultella glacieicola]|uniref:DNA polymerase III subunit epsilon n=1 Tax=Occultella glacieicola TaxID=2518684 RepID=A0ABY2EBL6_9MICO|nr:exonuclease domain-containing protein [Occultella glacieicola]TDE97619.1 DNA polymerase III subunit epsilon [Occultella glacieicola]